MTGAMAATVGIANARRPALVVDVSPTLTNADGAGVITTPAVTATASGGVAPYSYAWTWDDGGLGITINSPSSAITTFSGNPLPGGSREGVALCTVTDALGATAAATCGVVLTE